MELVMMTDSRPAKGGRFPEKTLKRRNVGFPISLSFPLRFSKEEIKETEGRKSPLSCDLTASHLALQCPKGRPLPWSDKKDAFWKI